MIFVVGSSVILAETLNQLSPGLANTFKIESLAGTTDRESVDRALLAPSRFSQALVKD